jgi:hypothetical protein
MAEVNDIIRSTEHYRQLPATETDPDNQETITGPLAEQEAKLQEMERNERGS